MSLVVAPGAAAEAPLDMSRLGLLKERRFLMVWLAGAMASTVRWLEMLAIGVFVFDMTGSPFTVALFIILRMAPLAVFGAFAGALAERVDRRVTLIAAFTSMVAVSLVLGTLVAADRIELWHIAIGTLLNGIFWVTDFPVRRTLIGEIAGAQRIGAAMSLDTLTNNGTRMLGPLLGGLLLEVLGLDGTYFLGASLYLVSVILLLCLGDVGRAATVAHESVLRSILEGLRHLRGNRDVIGVLAVTVVFNLWGFPFVSMIPVIGKDELGLSAFPVGLLMSAEGAGALIGAIIIVAFNRAHFYRRLYVGGTFCFLLAALAFSQSQTPLLSGIWLLTAGLGAAAFSAMQSTLIYLCAPAEVRSRMMGVLSVCIGTGPIGFLHVGMLADRFGAPQAVATIAAEGIVALLLAVWIWPELRRIHKI